MKYLFAVPVVSACLLISGVSQASPWIEAEDPYLRASLQQLADAGHLRGNVSTYPLMWYSIANDMRDIRVSSLSDDEVFAYYRVRSAMEYAQQPSIRSLQLRGASDERLSQGFGLRHREQGAFTASRSFTRDYVAGRIQTTFKTESVDGKSYSFEGSYLATTLGNWAIGLDQLDVWWGPGQDTALVLSSHAMPIQALRVNRMDTQASMDVAPWLADLGPFHVTAFIGRTQRAGALGDHPVFGARASWRPFAQLELGASYTGQWGGDDYSADLDQAFNVLALEDNDDIGNQRAGVDARLSLLPRLGLYTEVATRNRSFDDTAFTFGADYNFSGSRHLRTVFAEYTDVPAYFYNDTRDPAGYRRYGMTMGAAEGQDSEFWVVGYRQQQANGTAYTLRYREADYGDSNWRMIREYGVRSGESVERRQLEVEYQQPVGDSLVKLGMGYYHDRFGSHSETQSRSSESGFDMSLSWELRF